MTDDPTSEDSSITRRALLQAAAGTAVAGSAGCAQITTPADLAQAEDSTRLEHVVDAAWLSDNRDGVVVLDARDRASFRSARIYGARRPDFDRVAAQRQTSAGLVPDANAIAEGLAAVGVAPSDHVVVYGASVGSRVTRIVYALEHLGHDGDVSVLDGGFEAWPGRMGTGGREPPNAVYDPDPRSGMFVTRDWIRDRLGTFNEEDGPALIDVRSPDAYHGDAANDGEPALDRAGHVPGAIDVHWFGNLDGRWLKSPADLAKLYFAGAGLQEDNTVVVYGRGNVNATNTYVILKALGIEDVRIYDGGFLEWANVPESRRDEYPVETKSRAVIEAGGDIGGGGSGDFSCTG